MADASHRAGVVAILGLPNAGKSTLLNRLLDAKLAIVTPRPQTTRSRILGIWTLPEAQVLLLDTPGLHEGGRRLNVALNEMVAEAARECDAALLLVDLSRGWRAPLQALWEDLRERGVPVLLVGSKADLAPDAPLPELDGAAAALRVSAETGEGVSALRRALVEVLPASPPLYPPDELSDRPVRFLAAELIREAAFEALEQELPYALGVEVLEFDESRADGVRIRAELLLERPSQKRIVVGSGGAMIKRIGIAARREIEKLLGTRVHLNLWVRVERGWSQRPKRLESLGYR
jgi:GTP-binding protein Era